MNGSKRRFLSVCEQSQFLQSIKKSYASCMYRGNGQSQGLLPQIAILQSILYNGQTTPT